MKKEYTDLEKRLLAIEISSAEEFFKIERLNIFDFKKIENLLLDLEDGKPDEFFEEKSSPFASWIIPIIKRNGIKKEEWWQIEKSAKGSFRIMKTTKEMILATISQRYIVPLVQIPKRITIKV